MSKVVRSGLLVLVVGVLLAGSPAPTAEGATVTIVIGDVWFCDPSFQGGVCTTKINAGDTVVWDFSGAAFPHTTTECGASCDSPTATPLWDSGVVLGGGPPFQFTFNQPGTYRYYCRVHPTVQRGQIIVNASVGGIAGLPDVAQLPLETADPPGSDVGILAAVVGAGAALVVTLGGAAWYARRRWLR